MIHRISTTPFHRVDLERLRNDLPEVVRKYAPEYEAEYARRDWKMLSSIDRVYANDRARNELGWNPEYDFRTVIDRLRTGKDFRSPLAQIIGSKGYHAELFSHGPYPVVERFTSKRQHQPAKKR
jgi:UDP-glucose 4-epimerase